MGDAVLCAGLVRLHRREENKALVREGDRSLVGTMHLLRYAEENLPERYEARLEGLKASKLRTARAWAIKELLRELWRFKLEKMSLRPA